MTLRHTAVRASALAAAIFAVAAHQPTSAAQLRDRPLPAEKAATGPEAVAHAFVAAGLAHGQAFEILESLCTRAPKRLTGSEDAARAVAWAKERLAAEGFDSVHLEPCRVPHWVRGSVEKLRVAGDSASADANGITSAGKSASTFAITALGGSVATPTGGIRAHVLRVKSFDELKAAGEKARGCIVFFDRPMDPALVDTFEAYGGAVDQRSRGASEAARVGGVAAIVRSMTLALDDFPHTGAMRYDDALPKVPTAAISTLGADRLAQMLAAHPDMELSFELDCRTLEDVDSSNVVAELKGREKPDEIVLLGAHLDSWDLAQGAHDDGAGCAQIIEALRLLKQHGERPLRTVRICLFMNEESGLRGGRAYFDAHEKELDKHVLALETDRGGFAPQGFATSLRGAGFEALRAHVALLTGTGADRLIEGGGGADISPLEHANVPVCEILPDPQRYFDVHHCARDVLTEVNPRELELGATLIAALAWSVADAPTVLARNPAKPH